MDYYVYCYLDPRHKGNYAYGEYQFEYVPIYAGKGKGQRVSSHLWESALTRDGNKKKVNKLRKIIQAGLKPIIIKLHEGLTESEALILERKVIAAIGTEMAHTGTLTNLSDGGEYPVHFKDLPKETQLKFRKQRRQWMLEHNPMKDKAIAAKSAKSRTGQPYSDESKQKVSEGLRNSLAHKTACNDPRRTAAIKESKRKFMIHINQYDVEMNLLGEFESITAASKVLQIRKSDIMAVLSGRQKTTKGWIFKKD